MSFLHSSNDVVRSTNNRQMLEIIFFQYCRSYNKSTIVQQFEVLGSSSYSSYSSSSSSSSSSSYFSSGALQSLLGNNYILHPHRHCHKNPPGFKVFALPHSLLFSDEQFSKGATATQRQFLWF